MRNCILSPIYVKDHPAVRKIQWDLNSFFKEVVVPSGYPLFTWNSYMYAVDWSDLQNPRMVELNITEEELFAGR